MIYPKNIAHAWTRDRNWLEFLAVLDGALPDTTPLKIAEAEGRDKITHAQELFVKIAEEDGLKDRSGQLALLDLEKRARLHGLSQGQWIERSQPFKSANRPS